MYFSPCAPFPETPQQNYSNKVFSASLVSARVPLVSQGHHCNDPCRAHEAFLALPLGGNSFITRCNAWICKGSSIIDQSGIKTKPFSSEGQEASKASI